MRGEVRFRHVSPNPYKSAVMALVLDSVNRWRTEGQDQMLLLLDGTVIQGFTEQLVTVWRGNNKCQDKELR